MELSVRLPLIALIMLSACGEDAPTRIPDQEVCLDRRDGARYCVEVFESSRADATETEAGVDSETAPVARPGLMPWTNVTWAGAKAACEAKGKRLCERDEWIDACDGAVGEDVGRVYTYGDDRDPSICNTDGGDVEPTGSRAGCKSVDGLIDMSGNVWEWSGNLLAAATTRGGSFASSTFHECKSGDTMLAVPPTQQSPQVGFRCCRDG